MVLNKEKSYGIRTFTNGDVYRGNFETRYENGQGTLIFADGASYTGNFKNRKLDGEVTIEHPNGEVFNINYKNGKANGQGTMKYPNGKIYTGNYKNGKFHGQGTTKNANGEEVYTSNFENEKKLVTRIKRLFTKKDSRSLQMEETDGLLNSLQEPPLRDKAEETPNANQERAENTLNELILPISPTGKLPEPMPRRKPKGETKKPRRKKPLGIYA